MRPSSQTSLLLVHRAYPRASLPFGTKHAVPRVITSRRDRLRSEAPPPRSRGQATSRPSLVKVHHQKWSRGDSNPGPPPCKGGALPAKLRPPLSASGAPGVAAVLPRRRIAPSSVGAPGLEPGTSALSGPRSNQLSYAPESARVACSSMPTVGAALFPARSASVSARGPHVTNATPQGPRRRRRSEPAQPLRSKRPVRGSRDRPIDAAPHDPARSRRPLHPWLPRGNDPEPAPPDPGSAPHRLTSGMLP